MLADICGVMFDIVFPQYMFCFVDGGFHIFLRVEILIGKVVSFISEVELSLNLLGVVLLNRKSVSNKYYLSLVLIFESPK
jgi:hypothetical protein